ncbi:thermonuclease family protein, partial [Stutzerimonas nitrititolerans]
MRLSEQLRKASLVGAFFVSAFFAAAASAACSPPGPLQVQKVAQVIDGDTLRLVDGRSVRLIGLNTPELGRKGRRAEPFA